MKKKCPDKDLISDNCPNYPQFRDVTEFHSSCKLSFDIIKSFISCSEALFSGPTQ